ncbi:MAG: RDD family protein [Candidatus Heimdallarchaeota archaeon]
MSENISDVKEPLATFKQRAMAGLVPDYLVPILLMITGGIVFAFASDALTIVAGVVCQLAALLQWIANFIFRVYKFRGQTMGKQRQHITTKKIVDKEKWILEDLGEGDIGLIIGRAIVSWIEVFFIIPIIIPYLMLSSSNNNQTLADRLLGTVVVQIDPEEYDPKKKGKEDEKAVEGKTTTTTKTTKKKSTTAKTTPTQEGETNTPALISKFVLLGGSILPVFTYFLLFVYSVVITVNFSINAWGGFSPFNGYLFWKATNGFRIVSYICFFLMSAAIIVLALQYSEKAKTNLLVSGGLFGGFTILYIIYYEANWDYVPFLYLNGNPVWVAVGNVIFWTLAITALIISLFFFNKFIKQVNEEHDQNIPKFIGQYVLIPIVILRLIIFIIGVAAVPELAFGATIYYLNKIVVWVALFTLMGIFIGLYSSDS